MCQARAENTLKCASQGAKLASSIGESVQSIIGAIDSFQFAFIGSFLCASRDMSVYPRR